MTRFNYRWYRVRANVLDVESLDPEKDFIGVPAIASELGVTRSMIYHKLLKTSVHKGLEILRFKGQFFIRIKDLDLIR